MDDEKTPLVSIIIVNFNGKHHLEKCLPSLNAIDYSNVETILVDNNSTDGSIEFVEKSFSSIKITKLDKQRRDYITDQLVEGQDNTLDAAILKIIREQAAEKNYEFE